MDRTHLELSRELHLDVGPDGVVGYANAAARALLGDVVGRRLLDVLPVDLEGASGLEELRIAGLSGPRTMQVRWRRDDDGRRVVVASDLTVGEATRGAVAEHQRFVDALLGSLREGIVACDADGTLTLFNAASREFHGLPQEPLPADRWAEHYDLYEADGQTRMDTARIPLFRALQGEQVEDVELVIAPRGQPARTVLCNGRALRDTDGSRLGAVVAMHDITDRIAAEERLREQTARARAAEVQRVHLERLRELSHVGLRLAATEDLESLARRTVSGVRTLVAADAVRLTLRPQPDSISAVEGSAPDEAPSVEIALPGVGGRLRVTRRESLDADEQELVAQLVQLVAATAERIVLTDQRIEQERRQLRDDLLAGVTHDMQTPLAAISGFGQVLRLDLDDAERAGAVEALVRQTEVLRQLVLQFLDYVRLRLDRPFRITDGRTLVTDALAAVVGLYGRDERLVVEGAASAVVAVEPQRLVQVLANLVGNALRHGQGEVRVGTTERDGWLQVWVEDEGPGLPAPLLAWLRDGAGRAPDGVAGLGLAVTVPLLRALGGRLDAAHTAQGGTRMQATLPLVATAEGGR